MAHEKSNRKKKEMVLDYFLVIILDGREALKIY